MFSLGHGMMAANPSMKYDKRGDKKASCVISAIRTVTELYSMSPVTRRTCRVISAVTSFSPSVRGREEGECDKCGYLVKLIMKLVGYFCRERKKQTDR